MVRTTHTGSRGHGYHFICTFLPCKGPPRLGYDPTRSHMFPEAFVWIGLSGQGSGYPLNCQFQRFRSQQKWAIISI